MGTCHCGEEELGVLRTTPKSHQQLTGTPRVNMTWKQATMLPQICLGAISDARMGTMTVQPPRPCRSSCQVRAG